MAASLLSCRNTMLGALVILTPVSTIAAIEDQEVATCAASQCYC